METPMPVQATMRQLELFEAVVRLGSYTLASEEANVTQPAVSIQLKRLEEIVGMRLLEQTGKRFAVTEAGDALLSHARRVLEEMEMLAAEIDDLKGLKRGRLRISTVTTVNYFSPTLLRTFCERFPGVSVAMGVANRQELLQELADNAVDMVIMGQPPADEDLQADPFLANPLVIIAPPSHPLVGKKSVSLKRLESEVFLMREPGSGTRGTMERFFAEHGVNVCSSIEVGGAEALKQGVQAGLGLALTSRDAVELEVASGRLAELNVPGLPILRHWYLVHRASRWLNPAALAFKSFILDESAVLLGRKQ
jgi:DNA-binding transcriptional LysR family regulator